MNHARDIEFFKRARRDHNKRAEKEKTTKVVLSGENEKRSKK